MSCGAARSPTCQLRAVGPACLFRFQDEKSCMVQSELAESWALRHAVILARDERLTSVIFASDRLSLVQRMNSSSMDRSEVGVVVSDIKRLVACFSSVSFYHVKRALNVAAHILARYCEFASSKVVYYSTPECIRQTLCTDVY